jgi:hypothetical protein
MARVYPNEEKTLANLGVMLHRARPRLWRCLDIQWFRERIKALEMLWTGS